VSGSVSSCSHDERSWSAVTDRWRYQQYISLVNE